MTPKTTCLTSAVAALALLFGTAASAVPASGGSISAAIADPGRPDTDRSKDAARHPAELLAFLGIRPGDTIADIWPGDYWDRLFADIAGPSGKVYAVHLVEGAADDKIVIPPAGSRSLPGHDNVFAVVNHVNAFSLPTKADIVWIRLNYHDLYDPFMGPADVAGFNKAVFRALKPGGRFVVIDHVAPAGSKLAATNTTHRIDPEVVKSDMAAAGFRFLGKSDLLRNAQDPHTTRVYDPATLGRTDQFVFVFQRPDGRAVKHSIAVNADAADLALHGYDAVVHFTDDVPTKGTARYTATYQGARYQFVNDVHLKAFEADSGHYAPSSAVSKRSARPIAKTLIRTPRPARSSTASAI